MRLKRSNQLLDELREAAAVVVKKARAEDIRFLADQNDLSWSALEGLEDMNGFEFAQRVITWSNEETKSRRL